MLSFMWILCDFPSTFGKTVLVNATESWCWHKLIFIFQSVSVISWNCWNCLFSLSNNSCPIRLLVWRIITKGYLYRSYLLKENIYTRAVFIVTFHVTKLNNWAADLLQCKPNIICKMFKSYTPFLFGAGLV